jgi:hypothetical protein
MKPKSKPISRIARSRKGKRTCLPTARFKHLYGRSSAHVFNGRIYIYPSHDTATGTKEDDLGGHFDMRDYHILSMDSVGGAVTDHGNALDIKNVPWAVVKCGRRMRLMQTENIICTSRQKTNRMYSRSVSP